MCNSQVVLVTTESSSYMARLVADELRDLNIDINEVGVKREMFPNGERYYRLEIPSQLSLMEKSAVYIASMTGDEDIMDMYRIGSALVQAGVRRRVFVIPYLAYGSMDRAVRVGEVVTAKSNSQMLGIVGSSNEGNVFMFLDLHYPCILHYFEGSCLRIELKARAALIEEILNIGCDMSNVVVGSTNLRRASWVNAYAKELQVPVAFIREKGSEGSEIAFFSDPEEVIGEVAGKHVVIYDDIIRTGRTVINAAKMYIEAGASKVDAVTSHLALFDDQQIKDLIDSPIGVVITTNSHPVTNNVLIKENPSRFRVVDVSNILTQCLYEVLPSPEHKHRGTL